QSQMSSGEGMVRGQTAAGLPDVELVEYLRERTGQTTAMAPGPQGQMPGGGMHIGPQETQMGTMSAGQHGEMPGRETQMGTMPAGQHGEMPGREMRTGSGETQMGTMPVGQPGEMPGREMS